LSIKPDKFLECGSLKIARILFGLRSFSDDLGKKLINNEAVFGDYCITQYDPSWKCIDSGTYIFKMKVDLED